MTSFRSTVRLARAYAAHRWRRRRVAPGLPGHYAPDRLVPLTDAERMSLPQMAACINCGLCAVAVSGPGEEWPPPDLPTLWLRGLPFLHRQPALDRQLLESASEACPVGVPLVEIAVAIARIAAEA